MREDWIECELGEVCEIISGKNQRDVSNPNGKYPIYGSGGIFGYADNFLCEAGTTIIGRKGTIDSPIFVKEKFWNVDTAFGISPDINIEGKSLYFFCKGFNFKSLDKSTTIPSLAKRDLLKISFPLAPLPIQRAIVSKIEALFSDLDNGIANFKKAQSQLKIYRQAVLKKAFEGKLSESRLTGLKNEQDLEISRKSTNPANPDSDKKGDNLPDGWKWVKITEIAKINPALPDKANIDRNLEVQFLPMKLVEAIINKVYLIETRNLEDVLKGSYTPFIDGDIVFAKVTPCMENGKIAIVSHLKNGIGFGSSEFHVLRSSEKINNKYLYNFIVQDSFRNKAQHAMTGAVGLRRVPKQFIESYLIPLPPTLQEQNQIVQEIESRLSVCDKMEQSINESIIKAEALRQSILKKAFEGKLLSQAEIERCKKEADYEPASELLKKIQAEKSAKEQDKKKPRKK